MRHGHGRPGGNCLCAWTAARGGQAWSARSAQPLRLAPALKLLAPAKGRGKQRAAIAVCALSVLVLGLFCAYQNTRPEAPSPAERRVVWKSRVANVRVRKVLALR